MTEKLLKKQYNCSLSIPIKAVNLSSELSYVCQKQKNIQERI